MSRSPADLGPTGPSLVPRRFYTAKTQIRHFPVALLGALKGREENPRIKLGARASFSPMSAQVTGVVHGSAAPIRQSVPRRRRRRRCRLARRAPGRPEWRRRDLVKDALRDRLQLGDVARHLFLAGRKLVDALPHRGETERHGVELLLIGRRGGGRGRRDHVWSGPGDGCGRRRQAAKLRGRARDHLWPRGRRTAKPRWQRQMQSVIRKREKLIG
jgi:hypothetical protein